MAEAHIADGIGHIPLHNTTGSVVAWAEIDQTDFAEVVARGRWALSNGYVVRAATCDGVTKHLYLQRELLGVKPGEPLRIRFVDGNPLNCRRSNLRLASTSLQRLLNDDPSKSDLVSRIALSGRPA